MTTHQTDLAYAINHTPMSAHQWLIVALAVILNMLDGFDVLAIAFTAKSIQTELGLTGGQIGTLPILAGKLLDMGIGKDDLYLGASGFILLAVVALYFLKPNER